MGDLALDLASEARRTSLLAVLRSQRSLTLEQLGHLVCEGKYAGEFADLTIADLTGAKLCALPQMAIAPGESVECAVMRVFARRQCLWLASSFFVRNLGLQRWTAQKALADLADCGLLERRGTTSGTRYRFLHAHQSVAQSDDTRCEEVTP